MPETIRFQAFISYSHRDSKIATRLHRRLEGYSLPRALRGSASKHPLRPVFRDRDELASSAALSDSIQAALDAAAALIVLCSPAAVASRWVNEEIGYFRRSHPARKVLAFVVSGDPGADPLTTPDAACFPPNLLWRDIADPQAGRVEPAAPDARKDADGFDAAFLKLVAGLLDLPYDKLRQRELRRQQQRWVLLGTGSIGLSVVFGVLAWQAMIARDAARLAQARAELEAATSRQTSEFMVSLFQVSEPGEARGNTITAREVLDRGVERIGAARIDKPLVKSRLLGTMGQVYTGLGLYAHAQELLGDAEKLIAGAIRTPEESAQLFDVQWELADLLYARGDYEPAKHAVARMSLPQGDSVEARRRRAKLANLRGDMAWEDGDDTAAAGYFRAALAELGDGTTGIDPVHRARALGGLGRIELVGDRPRDAAPHLDEAYRTLLAQFGPDHPDTLVILNLRANAAYKAGDSKAAQVLWTEALESGTRIYGPHHPEVGTYLANLALIDLEACRFAAAEKMFRESLQITLDTRTENFDDLSYTLNNLALARAGQGDHDEALQLLERARGIANEHKHPMLGPVLANLAVLGCAGGQFDTGRMLAQESIAVSMVQFGPAHWRTRQAEITAAWCGAEAGAAVADGSALEAIVSHWGEANLYAQRALAQMSEIAQRAGDAGRASAFAARTSAVCKSAPVVAERAR